jgi:peptidoglycan/LPS O-acetylase OafA/YrhL
MSIRGTYSTIRFAILLLVGVPYAVSILLEGGPRNTEETATLFLISAAVFFAGGMGVHAVRSRRRSGSPDGVTADQDRSRQKASTGVVLLFLVTLGLLVVAIVLYLEDGVRRSGWTVPNCLGLVVGVLAATVLVAILVKWLFPGKQDPGGL